MISRRPPTSPARTLQGRAWVLPLLVVALLYGLLAMHGLGPAAPGDARAHGSAASHSAAPGGATGAMHAASSEGTAAKSTGYGAGSVAPDRSPDRTAMAAAYAHPAADTARTSELHGPRVRPEQQHADECECGGADGHTAHADATCAASGVSGAPSMDGPATVSAAIGPRPATGLDRLGPCTGGEREPPSLHRLQLLRI